jgi:predicted ATPase with chaperone activity
LQFIPQPLQDHLVTITRAKFMLENSAFSARTYDGIVKLARTIADLEKCKEISSGHLAEEIQYWGVDWQV